VRIRISVADNDQTELESLAGCLHREHALVVAVGSDGPISVLVAWLKAWLSLPRRPRVTE
jgi:hypothetical protein